MFEADLLICLEIRRILGIEIAVQAGSMGRLSEVRKGPDSSKRKMAEDEGLEPTRPKSQVFSSGEIVKRPACRSRI